MGRISTAAATLFLLTVTSAQAQYYSACNTGYYQPSYYPQNYYQYPTQKVVAQGATVAPLLVTVPVDSKAVPAASLGAPYYYSVSEAYQAKSALRDVIREELSKYAAPATVAVQPPIATTQSPTAPVPPTIPRQQERAVPPPPQPAARTVPNLPDTATPQELQDRVLAVFSGKGNCINCHSQTGKSGFKLVDGEDRLLPLPSDKRWKAFGMASAGAMPPQAATDASKAIDGEQLKTLLEWASIK